MNTSPTTPSADLSDSADAATAATVLDVEVLDTTLRDGSQHEGISLSVNDKLRIASQLDHLGVSWIEGGWPGANPKDIEFFRRAEAELRLTTSRLVVFGSTRRVGGDAASDPTLANLLAADVETICIVGKASAYHVTEALRTDLDEGVAMVADSIRFLASNGRRVFLDAEHFFDGFADDRDFSLRVVDAALDAGAALVVLCDTNGGSLPFGLEPIVAEVVERVGGDRIGIHVHNDTGCGVANSLAAVNAGARHVQGVINGYGERVGNANLTTIIADLELKLGKRCLPGGHLERLSSVSHHIAEVANMAPDPQAPFVGASAFAHKAGLHVSAIARRPDAYEHVDPTTVGNDRRFLVSELAGRATLALRAAELGIEIDESRQAELLGELKRLEHEGYHFEVADASFELLIRRAAGWRQPWFRLESYRVINEQRWGAEGADTGTEATVKLWVGDERIVEVAEGNGPVSALDNALRAAIHGRYPGLDAVHLTDYKVRVLDSAAGTAASTRVLIDTSDGDGSWTTIGVSSNVIDASWLALEDAIVVGLLRCERGA